MKNRKRIQPRKKERRERERDTERERESPLCLYNLERREKERVGSATVNFLSPTAAAARGRDCVRVSERQSDVLY